MLTYSLYAPVEEPVFFLELIYALNEYNKTAWSMMIFH